MKEEQERGSQVNVARAAVGEGAVGAEQAAVTQPLVVAFVAGDRRAFRRLFEVLGRSVFGVVTRYFNSPFDQEEAFQEAWLQLYRARGAFDVNRWQAFPGWARQVARNRCLDLLKARKRKRTHEVPLPSVEVVSDARRELRGETEQVRAVIDRRVREAFNAFVEGLDDEQRRFFALCFVEELRHDETARRLGITVRRAQ